MFCLHFTCCLILTIRYLCFPLVSLFYCFSGQSYLVPDTTLPLVFQDPTVFMPKLNNLFQYFNGWPFRAIIISNILFMVSMMASVCLLSNPNMHLVTLLQNSLKPFFFISFSIASCASLIKTKLKKFSIGFSSGDLGGILDSAAPIFFHSLLATAAFFCCALIH